MGWLGLLRVPRARARPEPGCAREDAARTPSAAVAALVDDLARFGGRAPAAWALLQALAWAEGPGIPVAGLWVPIAAALAADTVALREPHVRWLLREAPGLLTRDTGPGGLPVCRLADGRLADGLRGGPVPPPGGGPAGSPPWQEPQAKTQEVITNVLSGTVPAGPDGREWHKAHPYVRSYLAHHAAAAGQATLTALLRDVGFLAAADPATLPAALAALLPDVPDTVRAYLRAAPMLGTDPRANAAAICEARQMLAGLPAEPGAAADARAAVQPRYRTHFVSTRRDDSLLTLTGHVGPVYSVVAGTTATGRLLVASGGDDRTVRRWDPFLGGAVGEPLTGHGGDTPRTRVKRGPPKGQSGTYMNHGGEVDAVVCGSAPDGRVLLASTGGDETVRVWDADTGEAVGEPMTGHTDRVWDLAFGSVDGGGEAGAGRLLLASASNDMTVRVWDPLAGTQVAGPLCYGAQALALDIATDPAGRLVLACGYSDGVIQFWHPLSGEQAGPPLAAHRESVNCLVFFRDTAGRLLLASCGYDATVRVWDPVARTPVGEPMTGHTDRVDGLSVTTTAPGRCLLASCARDQTIRLWDPLSGTPVGGPLAGHTGWVISVCFVTSPDGRLLLASGATDATVRVWDPLTAASASQSPTGHTRWVTSVAFGTRPDGWQVVASASDDHRIRVWNPQSGEPLGEVPSGHSHEVASLAIGTAPDGRLLLASGSGDTKVEVHDALARSPVTMPLTGHRRPVRAVAFGTVPGEGGGTGVALLLASGSADGTVRVWDPLRGEVVSGPLTGHSDWVEAVAFGAAPDGRLIVASGSDEGTIRVWDPLTGTPAGEPLTGHTAAVRSLAFAPGPGGQLASASDDGSVRLWPRPTSAPASRCLPGHAGWVAAVAFTLAPSGTLLLVSGGGDNTVRLWDPRTGACLLVLPRLSPVRSLATSGLLLAIGENEGLSVIELADPTAPDGD